MTICFVPLVLWQPKGVDVQTWIEKNNTTLWLNDSPQAMQSFFCPVIGDGGVGKILCISYTHNGLPFVLWCTIPSTKNLTTPSSGSSDQIPSVFDNISIRTVVDGKPAEFCIWDLSYMNEQNRTAFPLPTADVFIICFSLTSRRACLFFCSSVHSLTSPHFITHRVSAHWNTKQLNAWVPCGTLNATAMLLMHQSFLWAPQIQTSPKQMTRMRTRRRSPLKKSKQKQKRLVRTSTLSVIFDLGQTQNKFSRTQSVLLVKRCRALVTNSVKPQKRVIKGLSTVVALCNESFTNALKNFTIHSKTLKMNDNQHIRDSWCK